MSALELCTDDTLDVVLQVGRAHRSFNLAKIPSASLSSHVRWWELRCSRILLILLGATSKAGFRTSILTEDRACYRCLPSASGSCTVFGSIRNFLTAHSSFLFLE